MDHTYGSFEYWQTLNPQFLCAQSDDWDDEDEYEDDDDWNDEDEEDDDWDDED